MQQEEAIKTPLRVPTGVWLPMVAVVILAFDCLQTGESLFEFFIGAIILLITHFVLLSVSSCRAVETGAKRLQLGKRISYAVVLVGGAWVVIRFALSAPAFLAIAYLDGFVLGGLSGSFHFTHKCKFSGERPQQDARKWDQA